MYKKRHYRENISGNLKLKKFAVNYFESDLLISADSDLGDIAQQWLVFYHNIISEYCCKNPDFRQSLVPLVIKEPVPLIIRRMLNASQKAKVGPMASVAGAIAEFVGRKLLGYSKNIIVENGGDIFIKTEKKARIGLFAGLNNIYNHLYLELNAAETPCGICTSSAKLGHSLSLGNTDACMIVAKSAIVSDCFATYLGNLVKTKADISKALNIARGHSVILGVIIISNSKLVVYGKIRLNVLDN